MQAFLPSGFGRQWRTDREREPWRRPLFGTRDYHLYGFRTMADGSGAGAVAASAIRHARLPLVRFSDNGGQIGSGSRGGVRHSRQEITFCPVVGAMADRSGDCDGVRKIVLRPVSRPPGESCLRGTEQVCGDSGKTAGHLLAAGKCDPIFARPNG